jgi:protein TonB
VKIQTLKWPLAVALSIAAHIALGSVFKDADPDAQIQGGTELAVETFGEAFTEMRASGAPSEIVEPVETPADEQQATESEVIETIEPDTISSEQPKPTESDLQETEPAVQPVQLSALEPNEQTHETVQNALPPEEAPLSETVETTDSVSSLVPPESVVPVPQPRKVVKQARKEAEPVKRQTAKKRPAKKVTQTAQKQKRTTSGNNGSQRANNRAGTKTGNKKAKQNRSGKKSRMASLAGNASVSNYPGKIQRKIRRAKVRPKKSGKTRSDGRVVVSFVVLKSGSVSNVRIIKGSGSANLDAAAVSTVRRAAPFPQIPDAARRSRWAFNVPIVFK